METFHADVVEFLKRLCATEVRIAEALERAFPLLKPPPPQHPCVLPGITSAEWEKMTQEERTDALRDHGYPIT